MRYCEYTTNNSDGYPLYVVHFPSGIILTGADSIRTTCAGAVSDALAINISISFFDMFAPPPPPLAAFLFFAVWMPKLAKTHVNTEAINVGSIFFCGKFGIAT